MIIVEQIGDIERRYSDAGVKILQVETGTTWDDAIDVVPCRFTYEETDTPISEPEPSAEEVLDILLGGADD